MNPYKVVALTVILQSNNVLSSASEVHPGEDNSRDPPAISHVKKPKFDSQVVTLTAT